MTPGTDPSASSVSTSNGSAGAGCARTSAVTPGGNGSVSSWPGRIVRPREDQPDAMSRASAADMRIGAPVRSRTAAAEPLWSAWACVTTIRVTSPTSRPAARAPSSISGRLPGGPVSTSVSSPSWASR